jgi:hypothetical protein
MISLNAKQKDIREEILLCIKASGGGLVSQAYLLRNAISNLPTVLAYEIAEVIALMVKAGELYDTKSFGGRRFYGILTEQVAVNLARINRKAVDVENYVVDAFNTLNRTERGLLLDKLRAIVEELDNE